MYDRLKEATRTNDQSFDIVQKEAFSTALTDLALFVKKIEPFLKILKTDLSNFLSNKQECIQAYASLAKVLNDYEDLNLQHYTDMDSKQLILNNP